MPKLQYDPSIVATYRAAATELNQLRLDVDQRLETAIENGNKEAASEAMAELKASGAEFDKLRANLTATDLFVAKYKIQVHRPHEVSFVLPTGVSRYEMLRDAQKLVRTTPIVAPSQLEEWANDASFKANSDTPERIHIDGHVEGGDVMTRDQQEALVESRGLTLPPLEDLAAAFVAYYVATGTDLFEGKVVRAADGTLSFYRSGLSVSGLKDDVCNSYVAVAARVLSPPARFKGDRPDCKN